MTTLTAYRECSCGQQLAVEIAYVAGWGPDGAHVDVMPEQSCITDIQCGHAHRLSTWLSTHEGAAWCEAEVEAARVEGVLT